MIIEKLNNFTVIEKYIEPVKDKFIKLFNETAKESVNHIKVLNTHLQDIERKIDDLEERFVTGEIERDLCNFNSKSPLVSGVGLEPTRLTAYAPQTYLYTNSNIRTENVLNIKQKNRFIQNGFFDVSKLRIIFLQPVLRPQRQPERRQLVLQQQPEQQRQQPELLQPQHETC